MATKNIELLYQYAAHVHRWSPCDSTVKDIFLLLNVVNCRTDAELFAPCSANGIKPCHIVDHLSICNESLQLLNLELREEEPGEFGFFPLMRHFPVDADQGPCIEGWTLLHWLLQEHSCIKTLTLPWVSDSKYQRFLSDALRLNSGLKRLTVRSMRAKQEFEDIIYAVGTLAQLEELDLQLIYLPRSALDDLGVALQKILTLKTLKLPPIGMDLANTSHHNYVTKFVKALKGCSQLAVLSCPGFVLEPASSEVFVEFVAESSSLRKLSLLHSSFDNTEEHTLFTAVGKNNNIQELRLTNFWLYGDAERQLVEVAAKHTGLRYLEVAYSGVFKMWETDEVVLADLVGRNTGLRELVFLGGTASCVPEFAEAIRKNTTMEKLTLGPLHMDVPAYRVFLQALACNKSLKLVTFKDSPSCHFSDVVLLMQETGTEGRLIIDTDVVDPKDLERGLKNSTSLTKVAYSHRNAALSTPPGTLVHLLHHHLLQELCIGLEYQIQEESATSLALLLSTTNSLKCVTFKFLTTATSSRILLKGLASNTSLTSLSISFWTIEAPEADLLWQMLRSNKTLKTLTLELLDLPQSRVLGHVPDGLLQNHYLLKAAIQQNFEQKQFTYIYSLYEQVIMELKAVSTPAFQFGVQELLRRNLSTLHRAVQFVMGSRGRCFAKAFERVSKGPSLVEALKKACAESEEDIRRRIAGSRRYLDEHFLAEAGVVRKVVMCGKSGSRVQLDSIGLDCWLCIRRYLKVTDIILKPGGLLDGPSSSKQHC